MDSAAMQRVRAQVELLLMQPVLQPLESAFGEYGSIFEQSFGEILAKELAS